MKHFLKALMFVAAVLVSSAAVAVNRFAWNIGAPVAPMGGTLLFRVIKGCEHRARSALGLQARALAGNSGVMDMGNMIKYLIFGLIGVMVALILLPVLITSVADAVTAAGTTYSGVPQILNLFPLFWVLAPLGAIVAIAIFFFGRAKSKG